MVGGGLRAGGCAAGYGRTGRLQPLEDAAAIARAEARAAGAADLWQGRAIWEVRPAKAWGAWAPASPTGQVVFDSLSARLHPSQACAALAAAITGLGGQVTEAPGPDAPPPGGALVLATGHAGLAALSAELGAPVGCGIKGQAALLAHDARAAPQVFADGVHVIPHADGTVAVGSTSERDFSDGTATDAALDAVLASARAACPALAGARVIRRWAGIRPRARSRAPMLGPHPERPGTYIANGGFKIGFGMAPLAAEAMAALILDGEDAIPGGFRVEDNL